MRVTILGCGTSTGVPVPGCGCEVCSTRLPKNTRLRSSALIELDLGDIILIDATPDFRQQALSVDLDTLSAVLYTHSHADHIMGTDDLRCFSFGDRGAIPCFGTAETLERIKHSFSYIFDPDPCYQGGLIAQLNLIPVDPLSTFSVNQTEVQALPLKHGPMEVLGFRIGKFAYATDCNCMPPETIEALRGTEILVLDGLRYRPHPNHFTIPEAIEMAAKIGAERTVLTHMAHSVDYHEVSSKLPERVELAFDGMVLEL